MARTFFEQHLKRYSKSRRKAPIYWQLATPSASYSVWLYAHRLTPDTFFHVLHDVVAPKLGLEERKLLSLTQEFGPNPTASQRKEIAARRRSSTSCGPSATRSPASRHSGSRTSTTESS